MLIKRRDNTQQRFKVFIITLLVMLTANFAKAGTYTGNDSIQVVLQTAEALSVVLDDNDVVFSNLIPGDVIDADLGFAITGSEDRSITCLFRKTNGQLHVVNETASIWIRKASDNSFVGWMYITLNSCDFGDDNTLTMQSTMPNTLQPNTQYVVNDLAVIVSYNSGYISSYT